jgi:hypothetical protein
MGKSKSIFASAALVLSFLNLGSMAGGQGMGGNRLGELRDRPASERLLALLDSDRIRTYLRLEDAQVERLRQIVLEMEKASVKTRAEIEVRSIELREALRADKPNREEILKKVQDISDLRGAMMKHDVEAVLAAKTVLSPEQQKRIFSLIETWHEGSPEEEELRGIRRRPSPGPAAPPKPAPLHPGEPPVQ